MKKEKSSFDLHPYMPTAVPEIRDEMLRELRAEKLDDLLEPIPEHLRYKGPLKLPDPLLAEADLKREMQSLLQKNKGCDEYLSFLGAGCYRHYVPAVCDEINSRAEFLTAYVGDVYSDHGKFQAFFEYCSMMAELLEMDVVSYPTFDGGQAVCSALRMALKVTGRSKLLIPSTMNPEVLSQLKDYNSHLAELIQVNYQPESGQLDLADLESKLDDRVAAVFFENPSYLGFLEEQGREISRLARSKGALTVVSAEPLSLGVLEPPANYGADLVCGDIQSLGIHMHYGGGCAGYIASHDDEKLISAYPTYLYGITGVKNGRGYGWGRALNWRTSHGSREQANEYMGTAAALWAITAAVYLALLGPQGMREIGETITARTAYARNLLSAVKGIESLFPEAVYFREIPLSFNNFKIPVAAINKRLLDYQIFGGYDLSKEFPGMDKAALYAFTELTGASDITKLVEAIKEIAGD